MVYNDYRKGGIAMTTSISNDFYTYYDWFNDVVKTEKQPIILCHASALECLELFPGYGNEKQIDVYAKQGGAFENIHYRIVPDFSGIETVNVDNIICTTLSQTVNDMLDEYDTMDEQALVEGLAMHYCRHGRSFSGINVKPEHHERFETIKQWASEHFGGGY
jgi:hypothetical protein